MKPTSIHLSVRRWFDKVGGNSYFAARIYADGEEISRLQFQYGYGSHPDATALVAVKDKLLGKGNSSRWAYLSSTCRDLGIRYTEDDAKALKREVVEHGKGGV